MPKAKQVKTPVKEVIQM